MPAAPDALTGLLVGFAGELRAAGLEELAAILPRLN